MYKFAFTYLVKQDTETWNDFGYSLKLLHKNILRKLKCNYKVLIFCEGEPITKVKSLIEYLKYEEKINIIIKKISLISYVKRRTKNNYIKNFPHTSNCKLTFSLGYRDMCKFFAFDVFLDRNLDQVKYFVRLDTDSFFLYTNKNFIKNIENFDNDYGYIANTIQNEDKAVSLGFGKCLYNFCKKNYKYFKFKNYLNICQEATLKPKIFYTNFEIVKIKWARSNIHKKIMNHIINSKGIYKYRWGDAMVRYYVISLLDAKTISLKGCLYKHSGLYDTRNIIRVLIMKSYSKLRGKLYQNNYETDLTRLDKVFLGV